MLGFFFSDSSYTMLNTFVQPDYIFTMFLTITQQMPSFVAITNQNYL